MVMLPMNYFLHCTVCDWDVLQRTLGCEPSLAQIQRAEQDRHHGGCPRCGHQDLTIRPANTFKGRVLAWLKGYS